MQLEGLALVIRSLTNVQQTPGLETPQYTVLRRMAEYEVGLQGAGQQLMRCACIWFLSAPFVSVSTALGVSEHFNWYACQSLCRRGLQTWPALCAIRNGTVCLKSD